MLPYLAGSAFGIVAGHSVCFDDGFDSTLNRLFHCLNLLELAGIDVETMAYVLALFELQGIALDIAKLTVALSATVDHSELILTSGRAAIYAGHPIVPDDLMWVAKTKISVAESMVGLSEATL